MHAASHNLQRGIHDTFGVEHKMFQGKRVKLFGELLSLHEELSSFLKELPSLREKLPSFSENMLARPRTYIDVEAASLLLRDSDASFTFPNEEKYGELIN